MALDPNRWTLKTQEAFQAAVDLARTSNHAEVTPDHLLAALLRQDEGIVLPLIQRVGLTPLSVRNAVDNRLDKLPKAYGAEAQMGRELRAALEQAREEASAAVERTHRRYRRDLVPLSQAVEVYRRR